MYIICIINIYIYIYTYIYTCLLYRTHSILREKGQPIT